jgi:hypothetical protein
LKAFCVLFVTCCLLSAPPLSAAGKKDDAQADPMNNEWVLTITAFDYSQLPQVRHIAGDVITRELVDKLRSVSYHLRVSPEYAYYEGYAWQQSVNTVARSISSKQDERSLLLYRGEPGWRYQRSLKRVDNELAKLQEDLAQRMAERPVINREPEFQLNQANLSDTFPPPPPPGTERRFCRNQKSDAFLSGEIREFHGRYYIRLKLFTLYTNSYVYEDDIIFSLEDAASAVDEISARLTAVLSGNKPAVVAVQADPPESQVLINQNFAGRGTVPAREHPPGKIVIAVAAEGYSPQTVETELSPGELTEVSVELSPFLYSGVNIRTVADSGASVYLGAMYVGEAPLTLRLPIDQLSYVTAETAGGEEAKVVFTMPDMPDEAFDLSLKIRMPPSGVRRVNKARARYYWSWGATWITGIAAWVTYGIFTSQNEALSQSTSREFQNSTQRMYYVSIGAIGLLGAVVAYDLFEMVRYLRTAAGNSTPIARGERSAR